MTLDRCTFAALVALALSAAAAPGPVQAQDRPWREVPARSVNSQGYEVTQFTARQAGAGCEGSQAYVHTGNATDRGVSRMTWARATPADGGVLCSDGTWYYGGGPRAGQPGGRTSDVLIRDGRFYRR
jgi:hypothetical protein